MHHRGVFPSSPLLFLLTSGFFTEVQTLVNCDTSYKNHKHCEFDPGGVRDLECFSVWGLSGRNSWRCEWKPGNDKSKNTYTLSIQQEKYCDTITNITGLSKGITIFESKPLTALVVDNPHLQNCTKAIFEGSPRKLLRCGPPLSSSFHRRSGILDVNVLWIKQEKKLIHGFEVRYKPMGDLQWKFPKTHKNGSILDSFNASQVYVVQVKCAENDKKCTQCPWSHPYIIPTEMKTQPVLMNLEGVDVPITKGSRLVSLTWKASERENPDGFYVSVQKASGEPPKDDFNSSLTEMKLHLSCSEFVIIVRAFNNVSVSSALRQNIPRCESTTDLENGKLNVAPRSSTSLTVSWDPQLLKSFVCFSVELSRNQHKTTYQSFFEDKQSNKTISLTEPLEPYRRYTLSLHLRQTKDTCNLKSINGTESTYGSTHFYFQEGTPTSAPTNISSYNVTSSSLVLQWSLIPEDELRGFLLGYYIYYREYNKGSHTAERNFTVDAELTSFMIEELKPGTGYKVQISGYTQAGAGVWSSPAFFITQEQVYKKDNMIILVFIATITIILIVACPLLKRIKGVIWPSIPNPENSNAVQKIEKFCEMELLDSLQTLKVEEWDTHRLQIIKGAAGHLSLPMIFAAENQEETAETFSEQILEDTRKYPILNSSAQIEENTEVKTEVNSEVNLEMTGAVNIPPAFTSGYTTLEVFQKTLNPNFQ